MLEKNCHFFQKLVKISKQKIFGPFVKMLKFWCGTARGPESKIFITLGVIHISADAKKAHFGTPPNWHYADIFLGPPLANSQRTSK